MTPEPDLPANPETEHVQEVFDRTQKAQGGFLASTVHHDVVPALHVDAQTAADLPESPAGTPPSAVYVTEGVPNLLVRVTPGTTIGSPEGHPQPGSYNGDDPDNNEFIEQGPTAHMLEARGFVTVLGVAEEGPA